MWLFFALAMCTFWALKPMKRSLLISYHKEHHLELFGAALGGAEAEQLAKVVNVFAACGLATLLAFLTRRLAPRCVVTLCVSLLAIALAAFAARIADPGPFIIWSFYVFGDMYCAVVVTLFWMIMNDSVRADDAKRLYGVVGLGGVTGGMVGATVVRSGVTTLGRGTVLLVCFALTIIVACLGSRLARRTSRARGLSTKTGRVSFATGESVLMSMWRLMTSRYLLAICSLVVCYEITSGIIDFQLSATAEQFIEDGLGRDRFFGFVGQAQGVLSLLVQLFLTSFVMRKFGVGTALLVLPVILLISSLGFLLLPSLSFATLLAVSDNSLHYSINQSARETLYVPTRPEEKYAAKALIDVFVQRFAKGIAVGVNLLVVSFVHLAEVRWLSIISLLVLTLWVSTVRFTGRRFDILAKAPEGGDGRSFGEAEHPHARETHGRPAGIFETNKSPASYVRV